MTPLEQGNENNVGQALSRKYTIAAIAVLIVAVGVYSFLPTKEERELSAAIKRERAVSLPDKKPEISVSIGRIEVSGVMGETDNIYYLDDDSGGRYVIVQSKNENILALLRSIIGKEVEIIGIPDNDGLQGLLASAKPLVREVFENPSVKGIFVVWLNGSLLYNERQIGELFGEVGNSINK
ncbi:MAG: hypothetical protein HYS59_00880 [Candidatus Vogelbacteria bacterium]|nr:hypothetical protein [Candidatus Vogelbacteria bacterium]